MKDLDKPTVGPVHLQLLRPSVIRGPWIKPPLRTKSSLFFKGVISKVTTQGAEWTCSHISRRLLHLICFTTFYSSNGVTVKNSFTLMYFLMGSDIVSPPILSHLFFFAPSCQSFSTWVQVIFKEIDSLFHPLSQNMTIGSSFYILKIGNKISTGIK